MRIPDPEYPGPAECSLPNCPICSAQRLLNKFTGFRGLGRVSAPPGPLPCLLATKRLNLDGSTLCLPRSYPLCSSSICCSCSFSQGQATVGSLKATSFFFFLKEQIQPPGPPRSRLCLAEWVCPETWPSVPVLKRPARWNDNLKSYLISFCWGGGRCCHRAWTSAVEFS